MIVSQDMDCVRQAALELMVESLKQQDTDQMMKNLVRYDVDDAELVKAVPARELADGYYHFAGYLMWMRGMIDSNVDLTVMADEAEGLRAVEAARQEFERAHPACPRCGWRQYSTTPLFCRNGRCHLDFKKGH